jgi:hypothetical protein
MKRAIILSSVILVLTASSACKKDNAAPTSVTPPPPADTATFTITHTPTITSSPTVTPTITRTPTPTNTWVPACTVTPVVTPVTESGSSNYCDPYEMDLGSVGGQVAVTGAISPVNDQDAYRFTATLAGNYTFILDCYTGTASRAYLWFYTDGCSQEDSNNAAGTPFGITRALTAGTSYRVMVTAHADGTLSQYRLTIIPPSIPVCSTPVATVIPEGVDATGACLSAASLGILTTGQIAVGGTSVITYDNDYYAFQAGATGNYTVILNCLTNNNTILNVLNNACDTGVGYGFGTTAKAVVFPAVSGNVYRVWVGLSGATVPETYLLTINAP